MSPELFIGGVGVWGDHLQESQYKSILNSCFPRISSSLLKKTKQLEILLKNTIKNQHDICGQGRHHGTGNYLSFPL